MKYRIIITRETTESTVVEVSARSESAGEEKALAIASADYGANVEWEPDDSSGMQSEPYATGIDES